ncbi:MAG: asparagine synthase (glutamine-hydrolyzing) [Spongiibacteraceae bacterium]
MCGIAGFQGEFAPSLLPLMSNALANRGPDHQAYWHDSEKAAGLVHARLSIIDLSERSNQPLWDSTGRYAIVFNGEIYNYRELRNELIAQGYDFQSNGDGEVILYAYIREGINSFKRLNGIYAFAIWDNFSEELLVVRDPFGVKPLYFAQTSAGFIFASEIKALLCSPDIPRDLDHTALWQALTYLWVPGPRTTLSAVRKLQPGNYLRVKNRAIIEQKSFAEYPAFEPAFKGSLKEGIEQTQHLLEQAVQRQLVADVPVGAFLSGGVDSSAICHFAAKALDKNLQCFTIELQGAEAEGMQDDLFYAKKMAQQLGVPLEIVKVTPDIVHDLPRMLFALDEPQADPAPLNALYISEKAREMNIKVLLSGAGGDDIFSGYRRHYALQQEQLWSWLPDIGRNLLRHATAALPQGSQFSRRISKAFSYANLPAIDRLISYFFWIKPQQSLALFNPAIRAEIAANDIAAPLRATLADGVAGSQPLNQMLYLEQKYFLLDHNFNYTDKTSMAAGVEVRVPFLDPDLVAFANRLPTDWKYKGREGKWILKKALEDILPNDVLYRPKTGFGAPLRAWLRGPLKPFVEDMLSPAAINRRGIFDSSAVQRLIADDRSGKIDAAYTIFSLICIEIWARQFVDQALPTVTV